MASLADDFCRWYAELDEALLVNRGGRWRQQATVVDKARAVCAAVEQGTAVEWPSDTSTGEGQRDLYATLKGLDWAFKAVHPMWMGRHVPPALAPCRACFRQHGRFSTDAALGALVPKLSSPAPHGVRPQRRDLAFDYVQCATSEQCQGIERVLASDGQWLTASERQRGLTIGCAAYIAEQGELDVRVVTRDGARHYRIRLRSEEPWASARVDELIAAFDSSGVQLAVLPEVALTAGLLEHWQAVLGSRRIPPESELRWVLAGTGNVLDDDPPRNVAVLLDARTGEQIVEQPKQFRFNLSPEQQRGDYAFDAFDTASKETLYEDIDVARTLSLVELGAMRLAVLICEDLAHLSEVLAKAHHNGVSHVLGPVLAKQTRAWHWEQQAAAAFASAQGTTVVVANSLVIPRMNGHDPPIPASLVHTPWGHVIQQADGPCQRMRAVIREDEEPEPLDSVA